MKIDENCLGCGSCVPHCPLAAIKAGEGSVFHVDQDECVECGVCLRANVCPANAIYQPALTWPRILRAMWSSVVFVHPETKTQGRGTEEMKTNDVTDRFKLGEVGFGVELGRPSTGARFEDAEKVTKALAKLGVEFEPMNPLTRYLNTENGEFLESWQGHPLDETFRRTKVMTFIIEFKTGQEKMLDVIRAIEEASKESDTVMSIDLISRCLEDGTVPVKRILDDAGVGYYINGKTCVGLGHPNNR